MFGGVFCWSFMALVVWSLGWSLALGRCQVLLFGVLVNFVGDVLMFVLGFGLLFNFKILRVTKGPYRLGGSVQLCLHWCIVISYHARTNQDKDAQHVPLLQDKS